MNRNIITEADVQRLTPKAQMPGALYDVPPAGTGIVTKVDSYFDRLTKYVPVEIIGGYLIVEGLLKGLLKGEGLGLGLFVLLLVGAVSTWFFASQVLGVVRRSQLAMSVGAFGVWVFATGGWFATLTFWAPGWGTIAVIAFAIMVRIIGISPLPPEPGT